MMPVRAAPSIASSAFWVTIEMVSVQGLSLMNFAILAHFLSARDFGLMATAFVFIYSLKAVTIDPVASPITRKVQAAAIEYSTVFWTCIGVGIAGCGLLQVLSLFADALFHAPGLGAVLRPMSLVFVAFSIGKAQEAWLMRHFLFRTLAIRSIAGALLGTAISIVAAIHHLGVWSLVLQQVTTSVAALLLLYASTPWKPRLEFSSHSAREIMRFFRGAVGNSVLWAINQNVDVVLVAAFFGPSSVGVYSIAKRLKLAIQLAASNPVTAIAGPMFANAQDDAVRLRQVFLRATGMVFAICAPIFLGAAAVALPAIDTIFGPRWNEAAGLFGWLSIGALCGIACDYLNTLLVIKDRQSSISWFSLMQTVMSIALFFILSRFGATMAAAPFVLPYALILPITVMLGVRLIGAQVGDWLRAIYPALTSASLMMVMVLYARSWLLAFSSAVQLPALCLLGAVIYGVAMTVIGPAVIRETIALARTSLWKRRNT